METRLPMTEVMFEDHSIIIMENGHYKYNIKNRHEWDFHGGPVVKIPHLHCRGWGLDPWSGTKIPHATQTPTAREKKDCGSLYYYFYYVAKLFLYQ